MLYHKLIVNFLYVSICIKEHIFLFALFLNILSTHYKGDWVSLIDNKTTKSNPWSSLHETTHSYNKKTAVLFNDMFKIWITIYVSCVNFKTDILKIYLSSVFYIGQNILRKSLKSESFEFCLDWKWIRNELSKFLFSQRKSFRETSKMLINVWNSWVSATCHTWQFSFYLCDFRFGKDIVKTVFFLLVKENWI